MNNTQVDNAKDLDVVMPVYNLIEYSENYSKTSGSLWQYYRDESDDNGLEDSESFKFQVKITGKTPASANTKNVKIAVQLKYVGDFWRTLKIPLINFEINLILTWSANCTVSAGTGVTTFRITGTKRYVPVVTLSSQYN